MGTESGCDMKLFMVCIGLVSTVLATIYFNCSRPFQNSVVFGYSQESPYAFLNEHSELDGVFVAAANDIAQVRHVIHIGKRRGDEDFLRLVYQMNQPSGIPPKKPIYTI